MKLSIIFLIGLRFLMVFLPQIGYIHPDEFFQSSEIVAGDLLNVDVLRAWEFQPDNPIRCIAFPYFMTALPILILKWLKQWSIITVTPYWLLVLPRVWMAILSLASDYSIYIMCQTFDINSDIALKLFSFSYVALVFMCRTFSNSLETFFVSVFITVLLKSSMEWVFQTGKKTKMILKIQPLSAVSSFILGAVTAAGLFNRPTFLFFIMAPALLWLFLFYKKTSANIIHSLSSIMLFSSIGFFTFFTSFVKLDQLYYKKEESPWLMTEKFETCLGSGLEETWYCVQDYLSSFVVTPWNFITYNSESNHLAQHGLHPRFLHFMVNIPMLLGPVALVIIFAMFKATVQFRKSVSEMNFKLIYLLIGFNLPVLYLSVFPHQEARFLLPIVPLACVLAADILEKIEHRKLFWISYILFNIAGTVFYGFLHQGGVVTSLMKIHSDIVSNTHHGTEGRHLVFYKTYMPPRHLLLSDNISVTDLAGEPSKSLADSLSWIKKQSKNSALINIVTPSTIFPKIKNLLPIDCKLEFICPHITMEDLPDLYNIVKSWSNLDEHLSEFCMNIITLPL